MNFMDLRIIGSRIVTQCPAGALSESNLIQKVTKNCDVIGISSAVDGNHSCG